MNKIFLQLAEKKLVGIIVRTNNCTEINPLEGNIFPCIQKYFHQNIAQTISHRSRPGVTYCVYTEYESDHTGNYTYLIGEEVSKFTGISTNLKELTIPAQKYVKFTNGPGAMPEVVREPWFKIWQMTPKELGGQRNYIADFEIYDERASDHQNIVLDIFIGIDSLAPK